MATMYVYNIPTNETVNLRKTASSSGTILVRVPYGKAVEASASSTSGWHNATYNGYTGYMMSKYLTTTKPTDADTGSGSTSSGLQAGHYVQVSSSYSSVNVRGSASTSGTLRGVLLKGTKAYCSGIVNDSWVKITWGGTGSSVAYVMAQYLVDGGAAPTSKKQRAIDIANSMKGKGYPYNDKIGNLGLTADQWCVQYCSWLMKAAGCSNYPDFSTQATVQKAINYFKTNGNYGLRANKTPVPGDWVFYTTTGSTESDATKYYAHVGFVVAVSDNTITTVEGNLGDTIKSPGAFYYKTATTIGGNNFSVLGFATPSWT